MPRIITCLGCDKRKKYRAKGLCGACYASKWRKENPDLNRKIQKRNLSRRREQTYKNRKSGEGRWTPKEEQILRDYFPEGSREELLEKLQGRTWVAIRGKARYMSIKKNVRTSLPNEWTEIERKILILHYPEMPKEELLNKLPGRTWVAIQIESSQLGIKRAKNMVEEGNRRPLRCGEVDPDLWEYLDFEGQRIKNRKTVIDIICPKCGKKRTQSSTMVRLRLKRNKRPLRCGGCSQIKDGYIFGTPETIQRTHISYTAFGNEYIDILKSMANTGKQVLSYRAIMAIKLGRSLIGKRDGLDYWEDVHHTSYPTLLDGSNLKLKVIQRGKNGRQDHKRGVHPSEPMETILAENVRLLSENRKLAHLLVLTTPNHN